MSDEPDRQDLEDRVDQLEQTISKMLPGRRDALKLGGAALLGGAAMSGSASAGTQQAGTIGTANDPVDLESEDINNADTVTTQDLVVNGTATGPFGSDLQGCRVQLLADQSTGGTSPVKLQFDDVVYDNGSNFDTSSHAWTCPQNGIYLARLQVQSDGGGTGDKREVAIGKSGARVPNDEGAFQTLSQTNNGDILTTSTVNLYSANDTISGYFRNNDNSDVARGGSTSFRTSLEVVFLGST